MQKQKRSIAAVLLGALLAAVTGCATLPSPEAMKAEAADYQLPKLPEAGKAIVYVVRPSGLGALIRFNVFVDDQEAASEVGYTRGGQYIYFNLPPGTHTIMSKAENWADVSVKADAGDIIYIQQEPAMGLIMARNSVVKLEDYQGKYHVKKLTLGTVLRTEKGQPEGANVALPPAATAAPQTPTPTAGAAAVAAAPQPQQGRQLTAEELSRHVGAISAINGQLPSGAKVKLEWTPGNGFFISTVEGSAESVSGVRSVDGQRLCLRPATAGSGMTRMSGLQDLAVKDCYTVYQTGPNSYVWKAQAAAAGSGVLSYTLP